MFLTKWKLIIMSIVVVVIMLVAGVGVAYALAALGGTNTAQASPSATATSAPGSTPVSIVQNANGQRRILGTVQALSDQAFVVTTSKDKHTVTVLVSASTMYTHAGKPAAFGDLKVGETVAAIGSYDATRKAMQATRVIIAPKIATPTPQASPIATATP